MRDGETHLLTGLCVAACRQKRRVRFATAAALVNELVEAKHQLQLRRVLARWSRYDLIAIDEVGYVPLAEVGAEFLFQVIAERAEKAAVIMTTNLPFSEWTQVIPNARLCKALLDRITDRAHIIETGTESYRFRRTAEKQKKGQKRREKSKAVEMTARGKSGKPKSRFPTLPTALGNPQTRFPHSPQLRRRRLFRVRSPHTASLKQQHPEVGQINRRMGHKKLPNSNSFNCAGIENPSRSWSCVDTRA